tara:strand:+ start:1940 stop:3205 length:1266 start_codon:yes stop_codon:yes gene_type:complete
MSDYQPQSDFLRCLQERGFFHQCTDIAALDQRLKEGPIVAYIGFDATSDCLHVGNLAQIMMLRWLQYFGHKPIVLMGGGTTKVGDPSGKDTQRQMLTPEVIESNKSSIEKIFKQFLSFGSAHSDALMVDNAEWLDNLGYLAFLRDVGKHFSINRMLTFDSVKSRLDRDQPLSFLEFNYMLLQAYDFAELNKRFQCQLQLGGSDQWGNIVSGIDLGRRLMSQPLFGWTAPLITTASGAKMGKTAQGAIWIRDDKLPAYDYWQFWRNTEDKDVVRFLKLFTDLPLADIEQLGQLRDGDINQAKTILANEATKLCHGEALQQQAEKTALDTFQMAGMGSGLPSLSFSASDFSEPILLTRIIVDLGFSGSNSQARRLIEQGSVKLDEAKIVDVGYQLEVSQFSKSKRLKLAVGKKKFASLLLSEN